jgi:hypothetical protein
VPAEILEQNRLHRLVYNRHRSGLTEHDLMRGPVRLCSIACRCRSGCRELKVQRVWILALHPRRSSLELFASFPHVLHVLICGRIQRESFRSVADQADSSDMEIMICCTTEEVDLSKEVYWYPVPFLSPEAHHPMHTLHNLQLRSSSAIPTSKLHDQHLLCIFKTYSLRGVGFWGFSML